MSKKKHELPALSLDPFERLELVIEARRADAARTMAYLVSTKLIETGYIVQSDIDNILEEFLESEIEA